MRPKTQKKLTFFRVPLSLLKESAMMHRSNPWLRYLSLKSRLNERWRNTFRNHSCKLASPWNSYFSESLSETWKACVSYIFNQRNIELSTRAVAVNVLISKSKNWWNFEVRFQLLCWCRDGGLVVQTSITIVLCSGFSFYQTYTSGT